MYSNLLKYLIEIEKRVLFGVKKFPVLTVVVVVPVTIMSTYAAGRWLLFETYRLGVGYGVRIWHSRFGIYARAPWKFAKDLNKNWYKFVHIFFPCIKTATFNYSTTHERIMRIVNDTPLLPKTPYIILKPHRYVKYYATVDHFNSIDKQQVLKNFNPVVHYSNLNNLTDGWPNKPQLQPGSVPCEVEAIQVFRSSSDALGSYSYAGNDSPHIPCSELHELGFDVPNVDRESIRVNVIKLYPSTPSIQQKVNKFFNLCPNNQIEADKISLDIINLLKFGYGVHDDL